ncbi:hypothetical protein [Actinophytocola sediminis]
MNQPDPLDALRDELTALDALRDGDPLEAARRAALLMNAAKKALRAVRVDCVVRAGLPPWQLKTAEVAAALGVHISKVNEMRAEAKAANRPQPTRGATMDSRDTNATTDLSGWGRFGEYVDLGTEVTQYLAEHAADFDVPALVNAYRDAINTQLADTGVSLVGSDFYSTYPAPDGWDELVRDAIAAVDLGDLLSDYATP